ncbi:hypothetical protein Tco_0138389 [Tanacetum coccineum]
MGLWYPKDSGFELIAFSDVLIMPDALILGKALLEGYSSLVTNFYKDGKVRYSFLRSCQNRRDLPRDNPLVSTEVLSIEKVAVSSSVILRVLRIILVILPEHPSDTKEHLKMEMEIPCSNKIKFITACSFSNDSFEDIMKAQVSVIKAFATLNIQAFKIKKSVSISF